MTTNNAPPVVSGEAWKSDNETIRGCIGLIAQFATDDPLTSDQAAVNDALCKAMDRLREFITDEPVSTPPVVEEGRREAVVVERVETVPIDYPFSDEETPPIWRVRIGEQCADFEHEQAARNFADAILALAPGEGAGEIGDELRKNPEAIWLSPRCETDLGRTWASPAPDRECGGCGLPWVKYVRSDLAALSTPVAAQGDASSVNQPAPSAYTNTVAEGEAIATTAQGNVRS